MLPVNELILLAVDDQDWTSHEFDYLRIAETFPNKEAGHLAYQTLRQLAEAFEGREKDESGRQPAQGLTAVSCELGRRARAQRTADQDAIFDLEERC